MTYLIFLGGCLLVTIALAGLITLWTQVVLLRRDRKLMAQGVDPDRVYAQAIEEMRQRQARTKSVVFFGMVKHLEWSRRVSARYWQRRA